MKFSLAGLRARQQANKQKKQQPFKQPATNPGLGGIFATTSSKSASDKPKKLPLFSFSDAAADAAKVKTVRSSAKRTVTGPAKPPVKNDKLDAKRDFNRHIAALQNKAPSERYVSRRLSLSVLKCSKLQFLMRHLFVCVCVCVCFGHCIELSVLTQRR